MARTQITQEIIIKINELYLELKTYSGVSRALGGSPSPSTVKKYIIPNYTSKEQLNIKVFDKELPQFNPEMFLNSENWGDLCELSDKEKIDIMNLWEEMSL
jgi:hypothetical protein